MKTIKFYLAAIAVLALLLTSCSKDEAGSDTLVSDNVASLYLGPVLADMSNLNRQQITTPDCSDLSAEYAQIRLIYGPDDTVVTVTVKIESDDQGLFTLYDDKLEIPVPSGETTVEVVITDFVVLNDLTENGGVPTWIAPKEGSEFEDFVEDALNSDVINLRAGSKNYVNVDVICFDDREVNLYGYQFFDITPIPLYNFCIFANYCPPNSDRHYTADYTLTIYEYDAETDMMGDEPIFMDTPNKGMMEDGTHWADPLCAVIPGPGDADSDEPYLYFEATLNDWAPYYTSDGGEEEISGYLTWDDVESLLDRDGDDDTTNYWHIFFNCDQEDGPSGSVPQPQ